ncbi:hypothetical protein CGRA01v4_10341 [Colletotrichum graminicola]|nr:hypothetical protein CGRA01v4_10341 [Colletotrichum graminicola]
MKDRGPQASNSKSSWTVASNRNNAVGKWLENTVLQVCRRPDGTTFAGLCTLYVRTSPPAVGRLFGLIYKRISQPSGLSSLSSRSSSPLWTRNLGSGIWNLHYRRLASMWRSLWPTRVHTWIPIWKVRVRTNRS